MNANTSLHIHEFSTGIKPDGTYDKWISRGFTTQYINSTLSEIPFKVERSIKNEEFTIGVQSTVAIIGRIIYGDESNPGDWSVVAIATPAQDEVPRNFPLYRYFVAEGADSLSKIVAWLDFRAKQGRLPIYNPFEIKTVGQPNISTAPIVKVKEDGAWLRDSPTPLIIPSEQATKYPFSVIDSLARQKAQMVNQPTSWAYNVEALEKPERFQIILPASDRALSLIQQALATKPKEQAASSIDEKALKQAIKGLADNPTVKAEQWQTFVENIFVVASAFPDPDKAGDYWRRLFDGQGASNAIKQGIYTQPMVRLLTIRAIALPETLPDFLQWLQVGTSKKGSYGETSLEFQEQLSGLSQEPRLKEFLIEGVRDLVGKVLTKAVSPEGAAWLLLSKQSLWYPFRNQLITDFRHDLKVVGNLARGMSSQDRLIISGKFWDKIWKEIQPYWIDSLRSFDEKYVPLAYLFDQLGDSFVSAHFCQLSYGQVPSQLFKQAFPSKRGLTTSHGLRIRQQGYNERGEEYIVPYPLVAAIAVLMLSIGLGGGLLIGNLQQKSEVKTPTAKEAPPQPSQTLTPTETPNSPTGTTSPKTSKQLTSVELGKAVNDFGKPKKTKQALTEIRSRLVNKFQGNKQGEIENKIKDVLSDGNKFDLQMSVLAPDCRSIKSEPECSSYEQIWVSAIYNYQSRGDSAIQADGIIDVSSKTDSTYMKIYKEVEKSLTPSYLPGT